MPKDINQEVYEVSLEILLSANVPEGIADAASRIVASDDSDEPNFGRTTQDEEVVQEAKNHYWETQRNEFK